MDEIRAELSHLRFALRRLSYRGEGSMLAAGAQQRLELAAERLDLLILEPMMSMLGTRPIVLVPTAELHSAPWSLLDRLRGLPVSVAPSAGIWLKAVARQTVRRKARPAVPAGGDPDAFEPDGTVVLVAGPDLPGALEEITSLGSMYPGSVVLSGTEARAAVVAESLEGAAVAHIAAHATFRADNGLWSALHLADGPLTVYELESLQRPPRLVVLSACQSGLSTVRPGDELMGLVAALLALGSEAVIASVVPVDDRSTTELMVALHRELLGGYGPAEALSKATSVVSHPATAGSFVCFGAG
jgi:CHAT domain-containing protein